MMVQFNIKFSYEIKLNYFITDNIFCLLTALVEETDFSHRLVYFSEPFSTIDYHKNTHNL